jgi:Isopenicillin N synthase and related dioxygenases
MYGSDEDDNHWDIPDPSPLPGEVPEIPGWAREALIASLGAIDPVCRILIQACTLEEMTPREALKLVPQLGLTNKQVSDKVRSCMDALRRSLRGHGIQREQVREWL